MKLKPNEIQAGSLIILLHIVGVIGYSFEPFQAYFLILTPFNLLITAIVLIYFHVKYKLGQNYLLVLVFFLGWFAEFIGVEYGFLFGDYSYGKTLGLKMFEIPLVIGINWLVLGYAFSSICQLKIRNQAYSIPIAAIGMVSIDFLIEPIAIKFDYWQWTNGSVPIMNYFGWMIVALLVQYVFHRIELKDNYKISLFILVGQALFFILLNLFS